jgi:ankyrin repeat protein
MVVTDDNRRTLTAAEVLQRYTEELLPSFADVPLRDVNQVGRFGDRPLHIACVRGNMQEVVALIDGGADLNAKGELGNTPLDEAIGQGHIEVVRFLLQRGASPSQKNELGATPLDEAKLKMRSDIAQLLA